MLYEALGSQVFSVAFSRLIDTCCSNRADRELVDRTWLIKPVITGTVDGSALYRGDSRAVWLSVILGTLPLEVVGAGGAICPTPRLIETVPCSPSIILRTHKQTDPDIRVLPGQTHNKKCSFVCYIYLAADPHHWQFVIAEE